MWQDRLHRNEERWEDQITRFNEREELVKKRSDVKAIFDGDSTKKTPHVQNICFELIESQVDTAIPAPKVTAKRKEDERLAKIVEDMLRDEIDRLPMEIVNDMMERTVPIQGGGFYYVEWDNSEQTQNTIGDLTIQYLHPKQVVPQDGVYNIEDMDYIMLKLPQTKEYISQRYGVDVRDESEAEPEIRGGEDSSAASDMVTQYVGYFRNDAGGIGKYSWVGDTELEDIEDYQARRLRRCRKCGAVEPLGSENMGAPTLDGKKPDASKEAEGEEPEWIADFDGETEPQSKPGGARTRCPYCGSSEFEENVERYEELMNPRVTSMGNMLPGAEHQLLDGMPMVAPMKVPYYKPDIYPVILQKSVSVFGQLLGDSDIDQIADQQNTVNRLWAKIMQTVVLNGSFATIPATARARVDNEEMKVYRVSSPADMQLFKVFDMMPDAQTLSQLFSLKQGAYEEARQIIGITDSYQGRRDTTATSGKAKEFAAQQSAGRLESKRVMKEAAYQQLFEAIFKFKLAYADEPRPIITHDDKGEAVYEEFDRYDFLRQDAAGQWYWNDEFIFDIDSSAPLARDREALWQETRMNFQQGAYGDPTSLQTLVFFWARMEDLHYPSAAATKKHMEEQLMQQQQMQMQQMQMQQQAVQQQAEAEAVEKILGGSGNDKKVEEANTDQPAEGRQNQTKMI